MTRPTRPQALLFVAAAALLALSACATPDAPTETTVASADAAKPKANCVRAEAQTGSMLSKRCAPALSDEEKRRVADDVGNLVKPTGTTAPGK